MSIACLNMSNNEQQAGFCTSMGARISFSSDFSGTQQAIKHESSYREAPVSSDFEFSVSTNAMNSADELFFKGKLLPLKEDCSSKVMTLRDELLTGDDCEEDVLPSPRVPKINSGWWKEKLGLKRSHIVPNKKADKNGGGLERIDEAKKAVFVHEVYLCQHDRS